MIQHNALFHFKNLLTHSKASIVKVRFYWKYNLKWEEISLLWAGSILELTSKWTISIFLMVTDHVDMHANWPDRGIGYYLASGFNPHPYCYYIFSSVFLKFWEFDFPSIPIANVVQFIFHFSSIILYLWFNRRHLGQYQILQLVLRNKYR